MSVLIAEAALLVLLIGISAVIIVDRRLMSSVITYCAFSFAAMLLYTIVGAADVAFTEAVIGTVSMKQQIFSIVIKSIRKKRGTDEEDR